MIDITLENFGTEVITASMQNLAPGINAQPLDMSLPTEEQEEALASSRHYSPQELAKRTGLSVSFAAVGQAQEVV